MTSSRPSIRETEVSDFYNVQMDKTHAYLKLDKYELSNIFFHSFGIIGNNASNPQNNEESAFYSDEPILLCLVSEPKAQEYKVSFGEIKELVEYHDKNFQAIEDAHGAGLEEYLHQKNRFYNMLHKINGIVESGELDVRLEYAEYGL